MSSTCFEPEGSSLARRLEECVRYQTHSSAYKTAYTDVCETHYNIPVYTTVLLKRNPRIRNM